MLRLPSVVQRPFACLLLLAAGAHAPASAQDGGAFSTVTVGVSGAAQINRTIIDEGWAPPRGWEAAAVLPFYRGAVEAGAVRLLYARRDPGLSDFDALNAFLGWHLPLSLPGGFQAAAGFRIGMLRMTFDDVPAASNARSEHEVAADVVLRIDRPLWRAWSAGVQLRYGTVLLAQPLHHAFLSAGLRRTFRAPAWLREVLR